MQRLRLSQLALGSVVFALGLFGPPGRVMRSVDAVIESDDARRWFLLRHRISGSTKSDALDRALAQARTRQLGPASGAHTRLTAVGETWVPLGPRPLQPGVVLGGFAGRVTAIAPHPTDPAVLYLGSEFGGVWKTADAGLNWSSALGDLVYASVGSVDVDPVDPRIIYASTRWYGGPRSKIFQSSDSGQSWREVPTDRLAPGVSSMNIGKLVVDPASAGTANATSVFAFTEGTTGNQLVRIDGAGRSTQVLLDLQTHGQYLGFSDLIADRSQSGRIFVLRWDTTAPCSSNSPCIGFYRSDDSGNHWTRRTIFAGNLGYIRLAQSRTSPNTLLVGFRDSGTGRIRLAVTRNAGDAWEETPSSLATGAWPLAIAIDPTNENTFYVGNLSLHKSTDSGRTWVQQQSTHADQTAIAFDASNRLISGNDGGVFRLDAGGWKGINNGLDITQAYSVAAHPARPLTFATGTQDTGTVQFFGPAGWVQIGSGDGGDVAFDPANNATYAEKQWNGSGDPFAFYRCEAPQTANTFGGCITKVAGINLSDQAAFLPHFTLDPTKPSTIWLAAERMYRTDDRGDNWSSASPSLRNDRRQFCAEYTFSVAAVAPSNSSVVYAGTSCGGMRVSSDRGGSWSVRDTGLGTGWMEGIAVDPTNPDVAYAVQSGFSATSSNHVFRTTNRGQSWSDITADLPNIPVNAILIDPESSPRRLYIGTDIGVFRATDGPTLSWQYFNNGMPPAIVTALSYASTTGTLLASTLGRGIWAISARLTR